MAADRVAAIDPSVLLGDWRLTRTLAGRRNGLSGTVSGRLTITGPDRWHTRWEVDGPDKAQRIMTWLSRSIARKG
jgi:hypothetical protein